MYLRLRLLIPLLVAALLTGLAADALWPAGRVGLGWLATGMLAMAILAALGLEVLVARPLARFAREAGAEATRIPGGAVIRSPFPELDPLVEAAEALRERCARAEAAAVEVERQAAARAPTPTGPPH